MTSISRRSGGARNSPGESHRLSVTRPNLVFRSLEDIGEQSQALLKKGDRARFLDKAKDSQEVVNLVEKLRTAIVYYQVSGDHVA